MRTQPPLYRKVGGLRFLRLGRLQLSFCICRPIPAKVTDDDRRYPNGDYMLPPLERTAIQEIGPFPVA